MQTIRAFIDARPGDVLVHEGRKFDVLSVSEWGGPYSIMECRPWPWHKYLWKPATMFIKSNSQREN